MANALTPAYLTEQVSQRVGEISRYNLRNNNDYQTIECKSQLYYNSFLPSTVREWNLLNASTTSVQSLTSFKRSIKAYERSTQLFWLWSS